MANRGNAKKPKGTNKKKVTEPEASKPGKGKAKGGKKS